MKTIIFSIYVVLLFIFPNIPDARDYISGTVFAIETAENPEVHPISRISKVESSTEYLFAQNDTQGNEPTNSPLNAAGKNHLFVDTIPANANIRILNIQPKYYKGIELDPGKYHIEVSAKRYKTKKLWITLKDRDKSLSIHLNRIPFYIKSEKAINSMDMKFVLIKPGSLTMGSAVNEPGRKNDETKHSITLSKTFFIQTTEVTQEQWQKVMGDNPSHFSGCGKNCPVERVSWDDIQTFINKLNKVEKTTKYRLPTEAEWEFSCRAGSVTNRFFDGDDIADLGIYAWHDGNSAAQTHPVAQKKPNTWGIYDMLGNVWEWCHDWYASYPSSNETDPKGPLNGSERVFRGGAWNLAPRGIRCAVHGYISPENRLRLIGFRLVREL